MTQNHYFPDVQPSAPEQRLSRDIPLTEADIKSFERFYQDFLGKRPEDRMAFLKALSIYRRGDLREYVHDAVVFHNRFKQLMPSIKQRDLLLSFPTVTRNVHNLIFDFSESYGGITGQTNVSMAKTQVTEHLDATEMFRLDLDKALETMPSVLPDDQALMAGFIGKLKQGLPATETFRFLIVILADHAFLGVIPGYERGSTLVVGKIREFLEQTFGARMEDHIVEFFVVGGGYLRGDGEAVVLGGHNSIFDPQFAEPTNPVVQEFHHRFLDMKFHLAQQILTTEFPGLKVRFQL
jgi:hypothetical protein